MARSGKAGGNMMMMAAGHGQFLGDIYRALFNIKKTVAASTGTVKSSYNTMTGSFKQNQRKQRKLSHCRKVKRF